MSEFLKEPVYSRRSFTTSPERVTGLQAICASRILGDVQNIHKEKRIPIQSVGFNHPEARRDAIDHYYLQEIDRQAEIASRNIRSAVIDGCAAEHPHDPAVWGALQATMFSTICIARLLKPAGVKHAYPGMSKNASDRHANDRGKRLREMLGVEDNDFILHVTKVRNAFEHYDEHIDSRFADGVTCFADWYITDKHALITPPSPNQASRAVGMRVFYPAGGMLYFEQDELDLFELDLELIEMKKRIKKIKDERVRYGVSALYGGHQVVQLMSDELTEYRFNEWQRQRSQALGTTPEATLVVPEQASGDGG